MTWSGDQPMSGIRGRISLSAFIWADAYGLVYGMQELNTQILDLGLRQE